MIDHPSAAREFNADPGRVAWHDQTLWVVRRKRDRAAREIAEWEELRALASEIKAHTLSHLDEYLMEFEYNATRRRIAVHWAKDAAEHNQIVHRILSQRGARLVVKSKSMLTEECHLNSFLERRGITVIDTDLGERIVQLAGEAPSHIVLPAVHKRKEEIGALFEKHLGTAKGASDPQYLTEMARLSLREKFLAADAAITGVNFAIAETGGVVVCTNEGNADLGVNLAPVHIACMGIEKIIPKLEHLGVFLRLLARSATGQPITTYSSHFHGPREGAEMHVVIVDNGRSEQLGREEFRRSLHCIRCGACINTCPVYRRSGGHSYGFIVPGPIGSVLAPGIDPGRYKSLPFASTLCGSCSDVCPVKIDLHEQLYRWRQVIVRDRKASLKKRLALKVFGAILADPAKFTLAGTIARRLLAHAPNFLIKNRFNAWALGRELPPVPRESFREWYRQRYERKES